MFDIFFRNIERLLHFMSVNIFFRFSIIFLFCNAGFFNNVSSQTLSKKDTSNIHFLNSRKFYIYKVEKGETLFNISQKFKIPQEEIIHFNREVEKTGLKTKMKLWIPAYSWLKKDSIAEVKNPEIKPTVARYKIAIVTRLNLPKADAVIDTSDLYKVDKFDKEYKDNLEFIEGALYASEILRTSGLKVHLFLIDSEVDTSKLIVRLRKVSGLNMIITNETTLMLKSISNYSDGKNIVMLSCGTNTSEIIKDNDNAFSIMPSSNAQCEEMGNFCSQYFLNSMLITIKSAVTKENERTEMFKKGWVLNQSDPIKQIDFMKGGNAAVADSLVLGKNNIVFIASSNEDFVSSLLTSLKTKIPEYNVTVIGLPTWQYFESIDQNLFESCNVHLFSSGFIDYQNPVIVSFRKHFRDKYFSEPTDNAYHGYDAFMVAGKSFLANGDQFYNEEKPLIVNGIYSDYQFIKIDQGKGYENKKIHVTQPAKDVSIDLLKNFKLK